MLPPVRIAFFVSGLLLGGGIGAFATLRAIHRPAPPVHRVDLGKAPYASRPEDLLFPPGFTLEGNIRVPGLLEAMLAPDGIQIFPADETGTLVSGRWKFSPEGRKPDEDTRQRLLHALGSPSSYEVPGKACSFNADILLRLEKDGGTHDIVFCFGCRQTTAGLDMSVQGTRTFYKCFCDTLPNDARLHRKRADFEAAN
ncbi:hypothetical protein [Luteolibacter luteus]|uniref:Uncharacterized protein n=1 Tax=Luteolibacter luteus TaxID=2728835 RepID=A0A858RIV7_9BACT|nr:hypothetical protein [Luteolibacter luteus]QJE96772.1 hypothetical protein HHL09_13595 [Luteolibacter luteus]